MKELRNLKNAKKLSKMEQKAISGGAFSLNCNNDNDCPDGWCCQFATLPISYCLQGTACMV